MVPVISAEIGNYLNKQAKHSILLKAFECFLFGNFNQSDFDYLKEPKMDYKETCALGYVSAINDSFTPAFGSSLTWLMGRQISQSDPLAKDNIALLGLILSVRNTQDFEFKETFQKWFFSLLENDDQNQLSMIYFFKNLLNDSSSTSQSTCFQEDLDVFIHFLGANNHINNSLIAKYFSEIMTLPFPYYADDFFRTTVNIYNIKKISYKYISTFQDFEKKIEEEKELEKTKIESSIKLVLDQKANNFAQFIFFTYLVIILTIFLIGSFLVWRGDWNMLEPKTFIFFGTPFLLYLIQLSVIWVLEREISLNPLSILNSIKNYKKEKLYKRFSL